MGRQDEFENYPITRCRSPAIHRGKLLTKYGQVTPRGQFPLTCCRGPSSGPGGGFPQTKISPGLTIGQRIAPVGLEERKKMPLLLGAMEPESGVHQVGLRG